MAVSELPGNPNAVWTVKKNVDGNFIQILVYFVTTLLQELSSRCLYSSWEGNLNGNVHFFL